MPNMANITVKKNDGTTDVVYTQQIPSAGDRSPALWRNLTVGTAAAHRPELRAVSHPNGTGTARRVETTFKYPTLVTGTDGKTNIADVCILGISGVIPQGMPDADLNEAVSQGLNLAASVLIKDTFKSGFAPS
jgi:hypothetical protein